MLRVSAEAALVSLCRGAGLVRLSSGTPFICDMHLQSPAPPPPPPLPPAPTQPPPPPPQPPAPPAPPVTNKTDTIKSSKSTGSELADELKVVLPQIQQRRLDFKKTPDIFIHQKSNPDEVVAWLEAKGFSAAAQRQLRVPGHQLFALSRAQLERALGHDEGKRLYSQVLVQRNVSGYKTTSASELQSILRKVREKVEVT
ncbi:Epidermal growth factor receptor kinase substrate 8-like protein 2 [Papilio xuthus]|uniref:Epidermal growth factor receptor kinase substrate 8-like protein 2 n=1 Tax=Papilio xuthus TaxID=66420 RepID=A0A0N0P9U0_PAPXU|nr:Epidermal growth factor receptor kinase substrate 8-like protein 2 [Papilio xuthus]